ncbi:Calcium-binding EF-hand-containing protein [Salinisphaera sp. PC39]|uniref:EF-hand domain-containing protein n=1 Tax=Salinisphaera sp. PC39 TaxID=1304156 RepID=UPI0033401CAC
MRYRLTWLTATALAATVTAASAQEMAVGGGTSYVSGPMAKVDVDGDGLIDLGEFKMAFDADRFFKHWDRNDDGRLSRGEYVTAHFSMVDLNKDGTIAKSEWDYSGRFWLEQDYNTDFDHWDIDGDGRIQREEFAQRLDVDEVFALWNTDDEGGLTRTEVTAGIHGAWDKDRDGVIDEGERRHGPGT